MTTLTLRLIAAACAFLAAAVSVGCGSSQGGGAGSASVSHTASKSGTGSPPSSSATGPVPTPTPARPSARNGTNYKACSDGKCEIAVSKPVTIKLFDARLSFSSFRIKKVKARGVEIAVPSATGPTLIMTVKKGCTAAFFQADNGGWIIESCSRKPDFPRDFTQQLMTVKDITDGTAILNLKISRAR
ncbi:hypothetical protein [Streptosporangium sp. NPDC023615]|uniref:hypothetical protein n=1 Tax=Streptosporangium sp. NPDC023615 TaxID=3154794 RepID=UPI00343A2A35